MPPCSMVEGFSADFVALVGTTGRELVAGGAYSYRVELLRGDEKPFAPVDMRSANGMMLGNVEQPPSSRSVRRFRPATGVILTPADSEDQRALVRTIASDVLNQFGITRLLSLP